MSKFVGDYVPEMTEVAMAGILARKHVIYLAAPGWGKTAVARSLLRQLADGHFAFIRVKPSTAPDVVEGIVNAAEYLKGRRVIITDGTPYAPDMWAVIIDEIGRANEAMFDALLDVCDRVGVRDFPSVIATSNFMPSAERQAALIDRFALWYWIKPGMLDMAAIMDAQMSDMDEGPQVDVPGGLTWKDIQEIRAAVPGPHAKAAVKRVGLDLQSEVQQRNLAARFDLNPRRATHWCHILYRVGVWHTGLADFKVVPDEALKLLKYAMPAITPDEQEAWAAVAGNIIDAVGAEIEAATVEVQKALKRFMAADDAARVGLLRDIRAVMQNAESSLVTMFGADNDRVQEAIDRMNNWMLKAVRNEELE